MKGIRIASPEAIEKLAESGLEPGTHSSMGVLTLYSNGMLAISCVLEQGHKSSHAVYVANGDLCFDCSVFVYDTRVLGNAKNKLHFGPVSGHFTLDPGMALGQGYVGHSLEGCPLYVGQNFAAYLDLESLKGCPEVVMGDFDCSRARSLKSYEHAPSCVKGILWSAFWHADAVADFDSAAESLRVVACDRFEPERLQQAVDELRSGNSTTQIRQ